MHAAPRPSRPSRVGWRIAMIVGIAAIALGNGNAGAADVRPAVAVPSLADASATTQAPRLFTVTGNGFTAGGRVYLAIYDQMGARLYETRWITGSPATTVMHHEMGDGRDGGSPLTTLGGTLAETFEHLCGATGMMRALDQTTSIWSNWLTVEPACPLDGRQGPH
jgi:hypothetical protein